MKKATQLKESTQNESPFIIEHEKKESIRLNKYISNSGYCTRKEADRLIESGKVMIDGIHAKLGDQVFDNQIVTVNGEQIEIKQNHVYLILNKPRGITCTGDPNVEDNIIDFMDYPETIFPVGRLDKDSSGLIILTNDGDIVNKILRSTNGHEKEYIVRVEKYITDRFIRMMNQGVQIYNPVKNTYQMTKEAKITKIDDCTFRIVITQGLNRQIRRMCKALGYRVITLERVRIMNIELGTLRTGQWRYLRSNELSKLNELIKDSTSVYLDPEAIDE
ncbi:pseudouridine synthase, partial [Anaerorhabdus sp.]|uniref:pseudouridine synthase n=1 Tax=Anaerorhabdus sp. TaxID=1872524 RepID=UPI002FCBAEE4